VRFKVVLIFAGIVIGMSSMLVQATITPVFEPADYIYWGSGQVIMADNNGVIPNVGDWDHDGDKDLMVGVYYYGNIYYYPNTGTNENPIFETRSQLMAGGSAITVTYG
jgi:hypothetical protein